METGKVRTMYEYTWIFWQHDTLGAMVHLDWKADQHENISLFLAASEPLRIGLPLCAPLLFTPKPVIDDSAEFD